MTGYDGHDTVGATTPEERRRGLLVRWRVWLVAALAAGAAATMTAAALMAAPEPVYSTTFVVGGVDMNSTTTRNVAVAIRSGTVAVIADRRLGMARIPVPAACLTPCA